MQSSIFFRPLEGSDFPLLDEWLTALHLAVWWDERSDLASIEAKYGPRVDGVERTHVFVIEHERGPIGWIQWYLWVTTLSMLDNLERNRLRLVDLAIGEPKATGVGLVLLQSAGSSTSLCAGIPTSIQWLPIPGKAIVDLCEPSGKPASTS